MELVFSTENIAPEKRYASWRDAICDVYVNVDVKAADPENYQGYVREAHFGDLAITDIFLSEQEIRRDRRHIAKLDKECYYVQLLHSGRLSVEQQGVTHVSNAACGALFTATEQYTLHCHGDVRSFYLEIPRDDFARRFPKHHIPVSAAIDSTQGLGRIATDFCASLAAESDRLTGDKRAWLGSQLMDILALAMQTEDGDVPSTESSVRQARLRSIQRWIEDHLGEPNLTLERIAHANNISLRYLHLLFRQCEMSASDWLWSRRLQRSYDHLARGDERSITSIAFDNGFSSSAHFSTMFRRKYGLRPSDLRRSGPADTIPRTLVRPKY